MSTNGDHAKFKYFGRFSLRYQPIFGLSAKAARELHPNQDADPTNVARAHGTADNWLLAIMIVSCCILCVAFAMYVLYPAMTTLVGSAVDAWIQGF